MTDELRQLNSVGIQEMREFIDSLRAGEVQAVPDLLWGSRTSESVPGAPLIEHLHFATKYDAGAYLATALEPLPRTMVDGNAGLWSWLSLYYFDELCPPDTEGRRHPRVENAYVLTAESVHDFRRYYRHLLMNAHSLVRLHGPHAKVLMDKAPRIHTEMQEQLASRQEVATNQAIIELAYRLYFDPAHGRNKSGAGSKGAGSPRRLSDVLQQFDVTYDLYGMQAADMLELLPHEFAAWAKTS